MPPLPHLIMFWKCPSCPGAAYSAPRTLSRGIRIMTFHYVCLSGQTHEPTCVQDWQYVRQHHNVKEFSFIFHHLNTLGPFTTSLHFAPYLLHSSPKLDKLCLESVLITFTLCAWPKFIRQGLIMKGHWYKAIRIAWARPYKHTQWAWNNPLVTYTLFPRVLQS